MGIEIKPERRAFIDREIARGAGTAEQITDRALRLYETHLEDLRAAIAEADAQIDRGEVIAFDPTDFKAEQDARFADRITNAKN